MRRAVAADGGADGPRGQRRDALTPSAAPRSVPFENEPPLPSSDAGTSAEPRDDDDAPPAAAAAAEGSAARGGGDEGDHVDDHDRAPAAALAIKSIAKAKLHDHRDIARSARAIARVALEVEALRVLGAHAHVCALVDVLHSRRHVHLVMEARASAAWERALRSDERLACGENGRRGGGRPIVLTEPPARQADYARRGGRLHRERTYFGDTCRSFDRCRFPIAVRRTLLSLSPARFLLRPASDHRVSHPRPPRARRRRPVRVPPPRVRRRAGHRRRGAPRSRRRARARAGALPRARPRAPRRQGRERVGWGVAARFLVARAPSARRRALRSEPATPCDPLPRASLSSAGSAAAILVRVRRQSLWRPLRRCGAHVTRRRAQPENVLLDGQLRGGRCGVELNQRFVWRLLWLLWTIS